MANYRTPPARNFYRPSRPHDYVYDPTYVTSSERDFYKDAAVGSRSGARIKLRPVYESMFSELKRDVRIQACLTMPQPNLMSNFMPEHSLDGIPVCPVDTEPPYYRATEVTGADRANYAMKYLPQNFRMERSTVDMSKTGVEETLKRNAVVKRGLFANKGVQTDYRESETQTDPYSPSYVLPYPGAYPKVMALIKLTWGNGLPATLEDIIVIERALERRLIETNSLELKDAADFDRRVKLLAELEAQRWADREKELVKILNQKLDITYKLLTEMYNKTASDSTLYLERLHDAKKSEADAYIKAQKNRYIREIRKMETLYLGPKKTFRRDIIKDYTDFNSQMYAPFIRNGRNIDMLYKAPEYEFDLHHNYEGFDQLVSSSKYLKNEMYFDVREFSQMIRKFQPTSGVQRMEKKLVDTFHAFRSELEGSSKRSNKYDDIIEKVKTTAPNIYSLDKEEEDRRSRYVEEKDIASVTLQKIARGRIIQDEMREELSRNMPQLLGMKTMYDMDPHGLRMGDTTAPQVLSIRQERDDVNNTDAPVSEIVNHLEGETLARMLDFLDKEMTRLLDERKIHSLLLLADRDRRMREATEAGRRQHEEENRRTNDEIFRQVVGIHQSTIDMYLEEAYLESINRFADDNAREYVQKLAETLNQAAHSDKSQIGEYEREELAAELVTCFLIPELNRIYNRDAVNSVHERYENAAKQVIEGVFSAQAVISEILDDMTPVLKRHITKAEGSVDASRNIVDRIIARAVDAAMRKRKDDAKTGIFYPLPQEDDQLGEEEELRKKADQIKSKPTKSDVRVKKSKSGRKKSPRRKTKPKPMAVEFIQMDPEKLDIIMKNLLTLTSVEQAYGAEVGKPTTDTFEEARNTVKEVFAEVKTTVAPNADDYSDQELPDDDLD